ncbi:MAG: hypothetical protein CUN56_06545 [Phototrophicales bacterium]|nr:MAG: hypothetical protein CUN56_06545 [Phototrophicales bacterium]
MIKRIQLLNRSQRLVIFLLMFGGVLMGLVALTLLLYSLTLNAGSRLMAVPAIEGITVREFVQLPGDDAYPSALAVSLDGVVYTASYQTGAVWQISPEGELLELPDTREQIGSVTGLAVDGQNVLYILDRLDPNPNAAGGMIWQWTAETGLQAFNEQDAGFVSPSDITVDEVGNLYVADFGRREVWRIEPNGAASLWWVPPDVELSNVRPTGLDYHAGMLYVTDSIQDTIYRFMADDPAQTEQVYRHHFPGETPGYDGIAVADDGTIYIATLEMGVMRLTIGEDVEVIARDFRGSSDLDVFGNLIYVTNFDSRSLYDVFLNPQLPFALDVITLGVD